MAEQYGRSCTSQQQHMGHLGVTSQLGGRLECTSLLVAERHCIAVWFIDQTALPATGHGHAYSTTLLDTCYSCRRGVLLKLTYVCQLRCGVGR